MTVVGDFYPLDERSHVHGMLAIVWAVSAVIGPLDEPPHSPRMAESCNIDYTATVSVKARAANECAKLA
jgi:hypothetical protein